MQTFLLYTYKCTLFWPWSLLHREMVVVLCLSPNQGLFDPFCSASLHVCLVWVCSLPLHLLNYKNFTDPATNWDWKSFSNVSVFVLSIHSPTHTPFSFLSCTQQSPGLDEVTSPELSDCVGDCVAPGTLHSLCNSLSAFQVKVGLLVTLPSPEILPCCHP